MPDWMNQPLHEKTGRCRYPIGILTSIEGHHLAEPGTPKTTMRQLIRSEILRACNINRFWPVFAIFPYSRCYLALS